MKIKDQGKPFEIIFVSSDRTDESFKEYFKEMPWLALPFDPSMQRTLSSHFCVEGEQSIIIYIMSIHVGNLANHRGKLFYRYVPDGVAPNLAIMDCAYVLGFH